MRILLAENSPFVIKVITELIDQEPDMELCGISRSWKETRQALASLRPQVLVLASRLDRYMADEMVREIMISSPVGIILLCGNDAAQREASLTALRYGALDIVLKPDMPTTFNVEKIGPEVLSQIRIASRVRVIRHLETSAQVYFERARKRLSETGAADQPSERSPQAQNIVAIGVSTGGPAVLHQIMSSIPRDFAGAILIAQHMPGEFVDEFISQLARICSIQVVRASHNTFLREKTAYVAGGDVDVEVTPDGRMRVLPTSDQTSYAPSVDRLFRSLAGRGVPGRLGVVLTGMGRDGASGAAVLRQAGGTILVQTPDTCAVSGMPEAVIDSRQVDYILPPQAIGPKMVELLMEI